MKLILALIITIGYTFANQSVKESDINGIWAIPEEIEYNISIGEIFTQDNKAQAYAFAYAKMENGKIIDRELTNEESNAKNLRGKIFLSNLEFNGKRWVNGKIYNPNNGGIYYAEAYLSEDKNTLTISGTMGPGFRYQRSASAGQLWCAAGDMVLTRVSAGSTGAAVTLDLSSLMTGK